MARISLDLDALSALSGALERKNQAFDNLNQRMKALNEQIESTWSGSAKDAYAVMTDGFFQKNIKLLDILKEFQRYTQEATAKFEQTDTECAQRIRSSF